MSDSIFEKKEECAYPDEEKDEMKGAKHYRMLAKKDKKNRSTFESMARDEEKHLRFLKNMSK